MIKKQQPIIVVGNNTPDIQSVSLFANVQPGTTSLNQTSYYSWDLAFETYSNIISLTIQYRAKSQVTFIQTVIEFAFTNIDQVLAALNDLNLGTFYKTGTTIKVANDAVVFGNLDLVSDMSPESWIYLPVATEYFMYMIDNSIYTNSALNIFCLVKTRGAYTYLRGVLKGSGVLPDQPSDQVFNSTGIEVAQLFSFAGRRLAFEEGYVAVEMQVSNNAGTDWFTYDTMPITESLKDRGFWQNTAPIRVGNNLSWQMQMVGARATGYLADKCKYLWLGNGGNIAQVCNADNSYNSPVAIANANIQSYPALPNLPSPQANRNVSAASVSFATVGRKIYQVSFAAFSNNTAGSIITQINLSYQIYPLPPFVVPMVPITTIT